MDSVIRLLIVAADPLVRSNLAARLGEREECQIAYVTSPAIFLTTGEVDAPMAAADLILWDMGWQSGSFDRGDFQDIQLPVVSLVADVDQAAEAWGAGSKAVLSREINLGGLLAAMQSAVQGLVAFDPSVSGPLLPSMLQLLQDGDIAPTPRELDVLQLLAEGLTNRAIAAELGISEHTVKFHVNALLNKFNAQSRTEAVVVATKLGFLVL